MNDVKKLRFGFNYYYSDLDAQARKEASDFVDQDTNGNRIEICETYPEGWPGLQELGWGWTCNVNVNINNEIYNISNSDDEDEFDGIGAIAYRAGKAWMREYEERLVTLSQEWLERDGLWDALDDYDEDVDDELLDKNGVNVLNQCSF